MIVEVTEKGVERDAIELAGRIQGDVFRSPDDALLYALDEEFGEDGWMEMFCRYRNKRVFLINERLYWIDSSCVYTSEFSFVLLELTDKGYDYFFLRGDDE